MNKDEAIGVLRGLKMLTGAVANEALNIAINALEKQRRTHTEVMMSSAAKFAKDRKCRYGEGECCYAAGVEEHIDSLDLRPCFGCCGDCRNQDICKYVCERVKEKMASEAKGGDGE